MAKSFEDNITRLEEIVSQLERGDAKLADSLKLFEEADLPTYLPPHTIPGQQTYFHKGHTPQRDHQGGHTVIQSKEHPPVIGPQHAAHGGAQHSQPPPHSGGQLL